MCCAGQLKPWGKMYRLWPEPISKIEPAIPSLFTGSRWIRPFRPAVFRSCFRLQGCIGLSSKEKAVVYQAVCQGYPHVLAFELGTMFAPNGEIFDEDTVRRLMDIPEIKGMKHSSLDRLVELNRLALRDEQRPEFRI